MRESDKIKGELLITTAQVAAALRYPMPAGDDSESRRTRSTSIQRARRWLKRTNAARKRGHRYVTTVHLLRSAFPEVWEELAMNAVTDE